MGDKDSKDTNGNSSNPTSTKEEQSRCLGGCEPVTNRMVHFL